MAPRYNLELVTPDLVLIISNHDALPPAKSIHQATRQLNEHCPEETVEVGVFLHPDLPERSALIEWLAPGDIWDNNVRLTLRDWQDSATFRFKRDAHITETADGSYILTLNESSSPIHAPFHDLDAALMWLQNHFKINQLHYHSADEQPDDDDDTEAVINDAAALLKTSPPQPRSTSPLGSITIITNATWTGGMRYKYLDRTGKDWMLITTPAVYADAADDSLIARWVNGGDVHDLTIDGERFTPDALQRLLGLKLNLGKGGFRMSKRLSRIMRPYHISQFLPADSVSIRYLPKNKRRDALYDGAATISRALVKRMSQMLDDEPMSNRLRKQLQTELKHAIRVEFTLQTRAGQDKGHAIISESQAEDFLLIHDTKTEVQATDDSIFVGLTLIHSSSKMRVDIQSLTNLRGSPDNPFWTIPQLLAWLQQAGATFINGIRSGDAGEALQHIAADDTLEAIEKWHITEYFASMGQTMHYSGIDRTLMNQHLNSIRQTQLEKLRLPMPGGRFYILPSRVGRDAGLRIKVRRGHILIDEAAHTAWLNDDDWISLPDSPSGAGIARILGGADNDDAVWAQPFIDFDDRLQMLIWRSPNQLGEYMLLEPEPGSFIPTWHNGETEVPTYRNDSRKLPPRIDFQQHDYLNLVRKISSFSDAAYSPDAMNETLQRIVANQGALGMTCNTLLLSQALYNRQPKRSPAPLEDIIDADKKTGDDLTEVIAWCYDATQTILDSGIAIPFILWQRLCIQYDPDKPRPKLTATTHHWLDTLITGIKTHIRAFQADRDALAAQAQPPAELFQYAIEHDLLDLGSGFNSAYAYALKQAGQLENVHQRFDLARQASEAYLVSNQAQASPTDILLGALASCYLNGSSDSALWQPAQVSADDNRAPGIAQLTLQALRSIGLLDHLRTNARGRVVRIPSVAAAYQTLTLTLNNVWFNWLRAKGCPYTALGDVAAEDANDAKQHVQAMTDNLNGYVLTLQAEADRLLAYGPNGHLFGYVKRADHNKVSAGSRLTIQAARARDGNVTAVCYPSS